MHRTLALLITFFAFFNPAQAQPATLEVETDGFFSQRERLMHQLRTEDYRDLQPSDRARINTLLDQMEELLGPEANVNDLTIERRTRAFNVQEQINALVNQVHADSRMVCRRETSVGSRRPQTNCATVGERRRARDHARQEASSYFNGWEVKPDN